MAKTRIVPPSELSTKSLLAEDYMKPPGYKTHNDGELPFPDGGLVGEVKASFDRLVGLFGPPGPGSSDHKTDVEWDILFDDGTMAWVYNWKNGRAYLGDAGKLPSQITSWHVGGKGLKCLEHVQAVLDESRRED